jgi:ABC-type sugar transport system ATPase subunit
MTSIRLEGVRKTFGTKEIIQGVDLTIHPHEFVVFVGPSGSGKSTLLRLIAGLEDISEGKLSIGSKLVNDLPPSERGVAMVFQSYALYPHMTVYQNMAFGLKLSDKNPDQMDSHIRKVADMLQITPYLEYKPKQLSGGQRQRVAIGRAIVREPKVFLFDEPLSNLDASLRVQTRVEIAKLHKQMNTTMIYVTHDQVEAMTLADKIVLLRDGIIEQVGTPMELYHQPCNKFVASFIGSPSMNFWQTRVKEAGRTLSISLPDGRTVEVPAMVSDIKRNEDLTFGVRPEHLTLTRDAADIAGQIVLIEALGSENYVYVQMSDGTTITVRTTDSGICAKEGENVFVKIAHEHCHLFRVDGTRIKRAQEQRLSSLSPAA